MSIAPKDILILAAVVVTLPLYILRNVRVWRVTPEADLSRIRAEFGGLAGLGGPNKRVVDIVHDGGRLGTRSHPPRRQYVVSLQGPDGAIEKRTVLIEAGLFGPGDMILEPKDG